MKPVVMLCAGERLTAAAEGSAYPPELAEAIRLSIRQEIARWGTPVGYTAGAAGPEIIFGEELIARGGELHIYLPCDARDFVDQYVAPAGGDWAERFHFLLLEAARVEISC